MPKLTKLQYTGSRRPRLRRHLKATGRRVRLLRPIAVGIALVLAITLGLATWQGRDTGPSRVATAAQEASTTGSPPEPSASRSTSDIPRDDRSRSRAISRSAQRDEPAKAAPSPTVQRRLWTEAPLNLRLRPNENARSRSVFPERRRIGVTGKRQNGYAQVVVGDRVRWVTAFYLRRTKPPATRSDAPVSSAPCANGVSASGGLQPSAQRVMNAVCNAFPEITTYGGAAGRGEHGGGLAIDIMVSGQRGQQLKQFLYANSRAFGLSNIIHARTIWSAARSSEGFRGMEDRGSVTQNHFDHVHVLVA